MKRKCNIKKVVVSLALSFLLSSCASNYAEKGDKSEKRMTERDGVTVSCKPQREIFVRGKCIKRRKYM